MIARPQRLIARQEQAIRTWRRLELFRACGDLAGKQCVDSEPFRCESNRWSHHHRARELSVFRVRCEKTSNCAGNSDSTGGCARAERAKSRVGNAAGRVVEVEILRAVCLRIPVEKPATGTEPAHHRLCYTERKCGCDNGVHGVATMLQHLESCFARVCIA